MMVLVERSTGCVGHAEWLALVVPTVPPAALQPNHYIHDDVPASSIAMWGRLCYVQALFCCPQLHGRAHQTVSNGHWPLAHFGTVQVHHSSCSIRLALLDGDEPPSRII
eukprot:365625-Chlamydomonas_euryale.AAC.6